MLQTWVAEIEFLQARLAGLSGAVFLEFNLPRMGRRMDAVLVQKAGRFKK